MNRRALLLFQAHEERRHKADEEGAPAPTPETSGLGKLGFILQYGNKWGALLGLMREMLVPREESLNRDALSESRSSDLSLAKHGGLFPPPYPRGFQNGRSG